MRIKTSRIGFFSVNATAPIVGGEAQWSTSDVELTFSVGIDEVRTGNALLDPEVHALVAKGSDGNLTFVGSGKADGQDYKFVGTATAGNIEVPLELLASPQPADDDSHTRDVSVSGTAVFKDIHIPLPGMKDLKHVDVHIEGVLRLTRH